MDSAEELTAGRGNIARLGSIAGRLVRLLIAESLYMAAAESCTGGCIAEAITGVPGSSACFWGSFVCYTSRAKIQMLGIGEDTLKKYRAVSGETAEEMVIGALEKSGANAAVSVTGLAGPEGDGSGIPVGTVWIAAAFRPGKDASPGPQAVSVREFYFSGSRNEVRCQAAAKALEQVMELIEKK